MRKAENDARYQARFDILIREAKKRGPVLSCEECDELKGLDDFSVENYILNEGDLYCRECFELFEG